MMQRWRVGLSMVTLTLGLHVAQAAFDPAEQMQFADGLYARSLLEMALNEYLVIQREAAEFEHMDVVLFRIGEIHRRLGNLPIADRFYQRVQREHPDSDYLERATFRRAELQISMGRYLEALGQFRGLLEGELSDALIPSARYYKGYAARRLEFTDEAETELQAVLERHPDSPFASYAALELVELYKNQPDRQDRIPALLDRAAAQPATPRVGAEALIQRADLHFRDRDYRASAEAYDLLLRTYPDESRTREAALQAAWAYHNAGRHADGMHLARARLDQSDRNTAHDPEWLYVLANCLRQLLRADEARAAYSRLIAEYPDHELSQIAQYESALVAFRQDQFDEAIDQARAMTAEGGMQADLYWLLAESYAALGRDDDAVQYYRLILEHFPDGEETPKAQYRVGRLLQKRGDLPEAIRAFRSLVEQHPDHAFAPRALFSKATCLAMEQRYADAVAAWDRLIGQEPDAALVEESLYQKALAEMQLERNDAAGKTWQRLIRDFPESGFIAEAYFWSGVLMEGDESYADAEQAYRAALASEGEGEWLDRVRFRLAMNLQRQDKDDEAADLVQGLLDTPTRRAMPVALLEWLAAYRLNAESYVHAEAAARALLETAETPVWRQIGSGLLGRSLAGQHKAAEARTAFEQSLSEEARTREGAEAALRLAELDLEAGAIDDAVGYFERAAGLAASDTLIDIRARAYLGLGHAAEAQEAWERAARFYMSVGILFEDSELTPESLYRAAVAYGKAGRIREQEQANKELHTQYPDSPWAGRE